MNTLSQNPSLDLVEFVETQILPQYAAFDKAHNMEHVTTVIRRSLDLAGKIDAKLQAGAQWNKVPYPLLIMPAANLPSLSASFL